VHPRRRLGRLVTDRLNCPGIDEIGFSTPEPGTQNSGYTKSSTDSRVSRTIRRRLSVRRIRRGR